MLDNYRLYKRANALIRCAVTIPPRNINVTVTNDTIDNIAKPDNPCPLQNKPLYDVTPIIFPPSATTCESRTEAEQNAT